MKKPLNLILLSSGIMHIILYGYIWFMKQMGYSFRTLKDIAQVNNFLDVEWYVGIADKGYWMDWSRREQSVVFFPLYSILLKGFTFLTGHSKVTSLDAFLFQRLVFFIFSLVFPYWVLKTLDKYKIGSASNINPQFFLGFILFFILQPTLVFFLFSYTEALFLILYLILILKMDEPQKSYQNLMILFLLSFLLALTRPTGLFLAPAALLYGFLIRHQDNFQTQCKNLLAIILGPVLAISFFAFILYVYVDEPFSMFTLRSVGWEESTSISNFINFFLPYPYPYKSYNLIRHIITFLTLWGTYLVWKKKDYFAFCCSLFFIILPMVQGKMNDIVRYSIVCVPAWFMIYTVIRKKPILLMMVTMLFSMGGFLNFLHWFQQRWVG